jgi:hypothetical protein
MTKVNQITGLNKKARTFLLEHCVSKKGAEVMAYTFKGFINGQEVNDITLIRKESKWEIFATKEAIQSINGTVEFFAMTKNTVL